MHEKRSRGDALSGGGSLKQLAGAGNQGHAEAGLAERAEPTGEDEAGLGVGDADEQMRGDGRRALGVPGRRCGCGMAHGIRHGASALLALQRER